MGECGEGGGFLSNRLEGTITGSLRHLQLSLLFLVDLLGTLRRSLATSRAVTARRKQPCRSRHDRMPTQSPIVLKADEKRRAAATLIANSSVVTACLPACWSSRLPLPTFERHHKTDHSRLGCHEPRGSCLPRSPGRSLHPRKGHAPRPATEPPPALLQQRPHRPLSPLPFSARRRLLPTPLSSSLPPFDRRALFVAVRVAFGRGWCDLSWVGMHRRHRHRCRFRSLCCRLCRLDACSSPSPLLSLSLPSSSTKSARLSRSKRPPPSRPVEPPYPRSWTDSRESPLPVISAASSSSTPPAAAPKMVMFRAPSTCLIHIIAATLPQEKALFVQDGQTCANERIR